MGRILDHFEKQELIERRTSQEDSRAQELYTTEKGAALAQKVRAIVTQQSEDFFKIIPENEQKILMDILKRAYFRLRDDWK